MICGKKISPSKIFHNYRQGVLKNTRSIKTLNKKVKILFLLKDIEKLIRSKE
jgi:hypothetical protein